MAEKRKIGRPSKLTEETITALVEYLKEGYTYAVCCAHAGIEYSTFRKWINRGREATTDNDYFRFFNRVNAAEMEGRKKLEARALRESKPIEVLERRYPKDWGKTDRVEGKVESRVIIEWAKPEDGQ